MANLLEHRRPSNKRGPPPLLDLAQGHHTVILPKMHPLDPATIAIYH
jgi:hypothetical protein